MAAQIRNSTPMATPVPIASRTSRTAAAPAAPPPSGRMRGPSPVAGSVQCGSVDDPMGRAGGSSLADGGAGDDGIGGVQAGVGAGSRGVPDGVDGDGGVGVGVGGVLDAGGAG